MIESKSGSSKYVIPFKSPSYMNIGIDLNNLDAEQKEKLRTGLDKYKQSYYEVLYGLVDDAQMAFKSRDRNLIIRLMRIICSLTVKIPEYPVLIKSLRIITQIFIFFRDWDTSIFWLEKLRDVWIMNKDYNTCMVVYKQAGMIFQHLKDYSRAVIWFKKMLQFAWVTDSFEGEINAYELLALEYFYLGDLDRTKFYQTLSVKDLDKSTKKGSEKPESYAKMSASEKFNKEIQDIEKEMGYVKKIDQIIDPISKKIVTIYNDLPNYKRVYDDLPNAKLYRVLKDDEETYGLSAATTFTSSLRKSFVRFIREGPLIVDLIQGEIPSPRETVQDDNDFKFDNDDGTKPNLLMQKMIAKNQSSSKVQQTGHFKKSNHIQIHRKVKLHQFSLFD